MLRSLRTTTALVCLAGLLAIAIPGSTAAGDPPSKKNVKNTQKAMRSVGKDHKRRVKAIGKTFKSVSGSVGKSLANGSITQADAFVSLFGDGLTQRGALGDFQADLLGAHRMTNSNIESTVQGLYSLESSSGNTQTGIIPGFGSDQGSILTEGYQGASQIVSDSDKKKNDALERIKRFFEGDEPGTSSVSFVGCGPPKLTPPTPGPFGTEGKDGRNLGSRRQGGVKIINLAANRDGRVVVQGFVPPNDPLAGEGGIEVEDVDGNIEFGSFMVDDSGFFTTVVEGLTPGQTVTASIVNITDGQVFSTAEVTIPGQRPR